MNKFYKVLKNIFLILLISSFMIPSINASWTTLWQASSSTYVKSYHGDNYWADEYIGRVGVWGIDRNIISGVDHYYKSTQITYDVQGEISVLKVESLSSSDGIRRVKEFVVKDKWNFGTKTKVFYNYLTCRVGTQCSSTNYAASSNDTKTVKNVYNPSILESVYSVNDGYLYVSEPVVFE